MKATAELVPMGTITVQLGERVDVGQGPKGRRLVVDVLSVDVDCDRVKASLAVNDDHYRTNVSNQSRKV